MSRNPQQRTETEIVRRLADASSIEDAACGVLETLAVDLGWDVALLWMLDEGGGFLQIGASWSREDERLQEFRRVSERLTFAPGVGLPGRVWRTGQLEWLDDLSDPDEFPRARVAAAAGICAAAGVPIASAHAVTGVLELFARARRSREEGDGTVLRRTAAQLGHYISRLHTATRLRESEEHLAAIFDAALDCVVTMDHRGRIVDVNPAAEATFGFSRDEVVGRLLADVMVPPEQRDAHLKGLERYVKSEEPRILNRRLEMTAQRADGSTFPIELTVTRLGRGRPPVFAGFIRDITERREAEAERRRLVKKALASRASEEAARVHAETTHALAEADRARMEFLARAGLRMAASMDFEETLEAVAEATVPEIADWCTVTLLDERDRPAPLALAHVDPDGRRAAAELIELHPPDGLGALGAAGVFGTRQGHLHEQLDDVALARVTDGDEHLRRLREVNTASVIAVPVQASGKLLGAITLVRSRGRLPYSDLDLVMASALGARAGLHIENSRLYMERSHIARTLQQGLLPARLPQIPGVQIAARYCAAGDQNEVGGDFYDVFEAADGAWVAIVGDVSGKGARAAVLTALARHSLYAAALRDESPARNLAFLNEAMLRRASEMAAFCTVVYTRLRPADGHVAVTLASGGHPAPLILRADGTVETADVHGTLVGAIENVSFEETSLRLAAGDLMLLYTDGAVELRGYDLHAGESELRAALERSAGMPAEAVVEAVLARVTELQRGTLRDDVALLALRAV